MNNKVICLAIDIINADKPPASLAFMAGACESAKVDYQCISVNNLLLDFYSTQEFNHIYSQIKLSNFDKISELLDPITKNILDQIKKINSNLVLVSLFSYMQVDVAKTILKSIKQNFPSTEIITGGPGVQSLAKDNITNGKQLLDQGLVDFYCLGEGDQVLVEFLQGNKNLLGLNYSGVPESWAPQISNLDLYYTIPSYSNISTYNYKNLEAKTKPVYSISTSRGCVRSCSFCDVAKLWPNFRYRSGNHVAQEILKHHLEVGAVNFTIVDSLINGNLKSFKEFNRGMIELKNKTPTLKDFSYNGMFIVRDSKSHSAELFKIMKDAGCESLAIGVETGSDRLRYEMNKKFTNADLDYHLEQCEKVGIRNALLTFVGYPTETDEDFAQSLHMLERYQKYLVNDTIIGINHSGTFSLLPDTPVYDERESMNIVLHNDIENIKLSWTNKNNPTLTVRRRIERDLLFRRKAAELRYPIPYSNRYLDYIKHINKDFNPVSD